MRGRDRFILAAALSVALLGCDAEAPTEHRAAALPETGSIADLRARPPASGTAIELDGVVVMSPPRVDDTRDGVTVTVQDADVPGSGLRLFFPAAVDATAPIGTVLDVRGTWNVRFGEAELVLASADDRVVQGVRAPFEPVPLTPEALRAPGASQAWADMFVALEPVRVTDLGLGRRDFVVAGDVFVRAEAWLPRPQPSASLLRLRGILRIAEGALRLEPRDPTDVVLSEYGWAPVATTIPGLHDARQRGMLAPSTEVVLEPATVTAIARMDDRVIVQDPESAAWAGVALVLPIPVEIAIGDRLQVRGRVQTRAEHTTVVVTRAPVVLAMDDALPESLPLPPDGAWTPYVGMRVTSTGTLRDGAAFVLDRRLALGDAFLDPAAWSDLEGRTVRIEGVLRREGETWWLDPLAIAED